MWQTWGLNQAVEALLPETPLRETVPLLQPLSGAGGSRLALKLAYCTLRDSTWSNMPCSPLVLSWFGVFVAGHVLTTTSGSPLVLGSQGPCPWAAPGPLLP